MTGQADTDRGVRAASGGKRPISGEHLVCPPSTRLSQLRVTHAVTSVWWGRGEEASLEHHDQAEAVGGNPVRPGALTSWRDPG